MTRLESRRLSALAATWYGQSNQDYVGMTNDTNVAVASNNIVDVRIRLSGLLGDSRNVNSITVKRFTNSAPGQEIWDYRYNGAKATGNAYFIADPSDSSHSSGDLYLEPQKAHTIDDTLAEIDINYSNHATDNIYGTSIQPNVNPNFWTGSPPTVTWMGQGGDPVVKFTSENGQSSNAKVDLTGAGPNAGPDGIVDFAVSFTGLPDGAVTDHVTLIANPGGPSPDTWVSDKNPQGHYGAERIVTSFTDPITQHVTYTEHVYGNPTSGLSNAPSH